MSLVYTITSGYIECQNEKLKIPFALVFHKDGVFRLEIVLPNTDIIKKHEGNYHYSLYGTTEKKHAIECTNLFLTKHNGYNDKVEFISEGLIKLTKPNRKEGPPYSETAYKREKIWFVELENLKTCFANFTHITRSKYGEVEEDYFPNSILDHTETAWVIDKLINNGNYFKFKLIKKEGSDNLLIDFREEKGYCKLYYEDYLTIKSDLIALLSFMNGGLVKVRKEHLGGFYGHSNKGFNSEIEVNYSFLKRYVDSCNDYLRINANHADSSEIFNEMFFKCFDTFQHYNKLLELDSLIFSLTVSTQTIGLKERYFILITALEKIAKTYSKINSDEQNYLIDNNFFEGNIKQKLLDSILPIKNLDKDVWNRMNSILSNLNNNNSSTKIRSDFLIFAKIPLSNSVRKLIKKERNLAVHEGNIGDNDNEMYNNYMKLDHILRDVILNIIGYFGKRNRKGYYASLEEFQSSNPKQTNKSKTYILK